LLKYINLEYHPHDSRIRIADDEIVQTLNQRMGTGGGNVPIILVLNDMGGRSSTGAKKKSPQQSERRITDILR
jgi:hypothetical protein